MDTRSYKTKTIRSSRQAVNLTPTEYDECLILVAYLDRMIVHGKIIKYTHIPNETYTKSWKQKLKNKNMGVKRGFPDYVIITNKEILFLEMKRKKGGVTSPEQLEWIDTLEQMGFRAKVCLGFDEARLFIEGKSANNIVDSNDRI